MSAGFDMVPGLFEKAMDKQNWQVFHRGYIGTLPN